MARASQDHIVPLCQTCMGKYKYEVMGFVYCDVILSLPLTVPALHATFSPFCDNFCDTVECHCPAYLKKKFLSTSLSEDTTVMYFLKTACLLILSDLGFLETLDSVL